MRRTLIGLIMAATMMTPVAAEAQNRDRGERREARQERREVRQETRQDRRDRQEARQEPRREARQQPRQEVRQDRREVRQQPRQEVRQQPRQEVRQQPRREVRQDRRQQVRRPPVTAPVVAQRNRGGDRDRNRASGYQRGWQGSDNPRLREHADRYNRLARENALRYGTDAQRRDARQDRRGDRRDDRRDWRGDRNDRRDWNRGWRSDRRYDWQRWRSSNRNVFRMRPYSSPYRNWNYRRFNIGLLLQPLFYSQRYWISDPWQYRLPAAPYGTRWVRYYNDVLLVDTYTGEVLDVIYGFFW